MSDILLAELTSPYYLCFPKELNKPSYGLCAVYDLSHSQAINSNGYVCTLYPKAQCLSDNYIFVPISENQFNCLGKLYTAGKNYEGFSSYSTYLNWV